MPPKNNTIAKSLQSKKELEMFFTEFLREFRAGLRVEYQLYIDKLVNDLVKISMEIPPNNKIYSFREVLILVSLVIQRKLMQ